VADRLVDQREALGDHALSQRRGLIVQQDDLAGGIELAVTRECCSSISASGP